MSRRSLMANLAVALTITAFTPVPVSAQQPPREQETREQERPQRQERDRRSIGGRSTNVGDGRRVATPAPATGPEVTAAAQATSAAAGVNCQIGNALTPGSAADGSVIYEVACASGPGYILVASTPPEANNCLVLAESARRAQAADPAAPAGLQCTLPENNNALAVLAAYAVEAGVTCQVDAGVWKGRTTADDDRYEIGCAGADGYWIEVTPAGAVANNLDCLEVMRAGETCQFTTAEEQVATVRAKVAGGSAPACDIEQVASKGANDNGRFYEVKCADGSGYIYRTSTAGAFEQAYSCAQATQIAGGCTLVDVSAAVAAVSASRLERVTALGFPCAVSQEAKIGQESGARNREVYEFKCSDRPLGVVAFLPASGSEGAEAMDCLSVRIRGSTCRFTTEDDLKAVMTRMLAAANVDCAVEDYIAIAPMDDGGGEFMEVKCSDGQGRLANFPASRTAVEGSVLTCAQAATREYACEL